MATIQENKDTPEWVDDLYQIEMTDPVMGGADGVANRQAKQLGARTQWLKKKYENQEDEFNKYKKSVESATELKAGVTKLTSDIVRHKDDGGYAVTPQAVVDYLASQSALVKDVNELRNYESNSLYVNVSGYYASTPGIGGGLFVADKSDKRVLTMEEPLLSVKMACAGSAYRRCEIWILLILVGSPEQTNLNLFWQDIILIYRLLKRVKNF